MPGPFVLQRLQKVLHKGVAIIGHNVVGQWVKRCCTLLQSKIPLCSWICICAVSCLACEAQISRWIAKCKGATHDAKAGKVMDHAFR